jgi:hypothetical protein
MLNWFSNLFPCSGRSKPEVAKLKRPENTFDVILVDEATMFPSVKEPSQERISENQPDPEVNQTESISSNSNTSQPEATPKSRKFNSKESSKEVTLQCKLCKKAAEGFCCACPKEKFCGSCFKTFHSNLPIFHKFFIFNGPTSEPMTVKKFSTLSQKFSRLV